MKKIFTLLLVALLCLGVLAGCSQNDENKSEELAVYSFCGENEQFVVMNGVIVINADEEIFYGGDLEVINRKCFTDISSYSVTFYTVTNGEKRTIMSNSVVDQTGSSINVSGDLGRMSGEDIIIGSKVDNADDIKNNLYFELNTTDLNGEQNTYQLQLTITEITCKE
uniref:hypothetical protein n=1 Tax=Agathobacter sp. TaxID=2021311 RepID=UPI004055AACA